MGAILEQNPDQDGKNVVSHMAPPATSDKNEEKKELPNRIKYFTAAVIFYGNISFGCALNMYGPTITTLQNKYETDDATISKAFSILTGCYMLGAFAAGFIYNHVNRQLAVITIMITMAAMVFVTPFCPTLATYFSSVTILGVCCGLYDTAQFVWMMEMMQKDCPPFVQSQHFFYAVGANLVSWIMSPFLDHGHHGSLETPNATDASHLIIPYTIVGILVSINALAQIFLFSFMRYYPPPPEVIEDNSPKPSLKKTQEISSEESGFKIGQWSLQKLRIVLLCVLFCSSYQGMEMSTFQFYPKFGQNSDLHLSESDSSYVLTGMTASFAIGRGIAIIAVFKISTQLILLFNIIFLFLGNILLFGWASTSLVMLWSSGIIFGIGFSSVYASFCAWMERYLNFTNFIGSLMLVGGSGIAAIYPLIIGNFIEDDPKVLSYTNGVSVGVVTLAFGILCYLTYKNKTRY